MTVLADRDILDAIHNGSLVVDLRDGRAIQPASIDLHLGDELRQMTASRVSFIDFDAPSFGQDIEKAFVRLPLDSLGRWLLQPGAFVLGCSRERIEIGPTFMGTVCGVSTKARAALLVESAGLIDPGFSGQVTWEIANLGPCVLVLRPGMRIGQLKVERLSSKVLQPYAVRGRYQHQTGPTTARADRRVAK